MGINYIILLSKQGKIRLSKWYNLIGENEKKRIIKEVSSIIQLRKPKMCNVIEYKENKLIYKRYASLFFLVNIDNNDNELITLDLIQRFVELLDKCYGNVCELDIVFNFQLAYYILDELIINGELQESSTNEILKKIKFQDELEKSNLVENNLTVNYK